MGRDSSVGIVTDIGSPDSSVGMATRYGLDGPRIESRWSARFSAPVQTGPAAHYRVKVKFTLEQATKAQRGSSDIALLFL